MPLKSTSRRWFPISFLVLFGMFATAPQSPAQDRKKILRAGASVVDITPRSFPVSSNGGMSDRSVERAHDPLSARALVLDNGSVRIAVVVVDSCMIPRDIIDAAREKASRSTGTPAGNMLVSATHTHSAVTVGGVFQSEPEAAYREFLKERIAQSIVEAASRLEAARIGWAVGNNARQVFNRRWFMRSGYQYVDPFDSGTDRVRMNPPQGSSQLLAPAGPIDPSIPVLSVQSRDGRPLALLANYSLHYVGGVAPGGLSADYFGAQSRNGDSLVLPWGLGGLGTRRSGDSLVLRVRGTASAAGDLEWGQSRSGLGEVGTVWCQWPSKMSGFWPLKMSGFSVWSGRGVGTVWFFAGMGTVWRGEVGTVWYFGRDLGMGTVWFFACAGRPRRPGTPWCEPTTTWGVEHRHPQVVQSQ